jgi:hypothetical protein
MVFEQAEIAADIALNGMNFYTRYIPPHIGDPCRQGASPRETMTTG